MRSGTQLVVALAAIAAASATWVEPHVSLANWTAIVTGNPTAPFVSAMAVDSRSTNNDVYVAFQFLGTLSVGADSFTAPCTTAVILRLQSTEAGPASDGFAVEFGCELTSDFHTVLNMTVDEDSSSLLVLFQSSVSPSNNSVEINGVTYPDLATSGFANGVVRIPLTSSNAPSPVWMHELDITGFNVRALDVVAGTVLVAGTTFGAFNYSGFSAPAPAGRTTSVLIGLDLTSSNVVSLDVLGPNLASPGAVVTAIAHHDSSPDVFLLGYLETYYTSWTSGWEAAPGLVLPVVGTHNRVPFLLRGLYNAVGPNVTAGLVPSGAWEVHGSYSDAEFLSLAVSSMTVAVGGKFRGGSFGLRSDASTDEPVFSKPIPAVSYIDTAFVAVGDWTAELTVDWVRTWAGTAGTTGLSSSCKGVAISASEDLVFAGGVFGGNHGRLVTHGDGAPTDRNALRVATTSTNEYTTDSIVVAYQLWTGAVHNFEVFGAATNDAVNLIAANPATSNGVFVAGHFNTRLQFGAPVIEDIELAAPDNLNGLYVASFVLPGMEPVVFIPAVDEPLPVPLPSGAPSPLPSPLPSGAPLPSPTVAPVPRTDAFTIYEDRGLVVGLLDGHSVMTSGFSMNESIVTGPPVLSILDDGTVFLSDTFPSIWLGLPLPLHFLRHLPARFQVDPLPYALTGTVQCDMPPPMAYPMPPVPRTHVTLALLDTFSGGLFDPNEALLAQALSDRLDLQSYNSSLVNVTLGLTNVDTKNVTVFIAGNPTEVLAYTYQLDLQIFAPVEGASPQSVNELVSIALDLQELPPNLLNPLDLADQTRFAHMLARQILRAAGRPVSFIGPRRCRLENVNILAESSRPDPTFAGI